MGVDSENGVGVILVDRDGRILCQLRDDIEGIAWPEMWSIPGGAIEVGEEPEHAAVREVEEEVGQTVAPLHLIGRMARFWGGAGILHLFCTGAAFSDTDIVVGEGQDARFFTPREIAALEPAAPFLKPLVSGFVSDSRYALCISDARRSG